MAKYKIIFIPTDPSYETMTLEKYDTYHDAEKNIDGIIDMKKNNGITCFIKRKDGKGVEWINNVKGEFKIISNEKTQSGCILI